MKSIITLGRQLGSGGKLIGKALAEQLGIPFYDKALIARTAKDSGLSEHLFDGIEEKPTHSLLYSLVLGVQSTKGLYYQYSDMLNGDNVFKIQADVIRSIAEEGPCIIVGRCADYILRDNPHLIRLFIYADEEHRAQNLIKRDGMSEKEAHLAVNKADKRRANYYNFYTNSIWGDVKNYDLCLNAGILSQEECVKILIDYIAKREANFHD